MAAGGRDSSIFPPPFPLAIDKFSRFFVRLLEADKEFRKKMVERCDRLFGIHDSANAVITRQTISNPFSKVTEDISNAYLEIATPIADAAKIENTSLERMSAINSRFFKAYPEILKTNYEPHGYQRTCLTGKTTKERTKEIAQIKIEEAVRNPKASIILHTPGNNSREGLAVALMEYTALMEEILAYVEKTKDTRTAISLIPRINFVNSSAGGKGTAMTKVEGKAISRLPRTLSIPRASSGRLLPTNFSLQDE